ncbi:MAG TPA: peptidylprolyl isomerase [Opitutaceae bacterium]|nr:peptidylprolyl isomerase [Opitutaceae bacterium]
MTLARNAGAACAAFLIAVCARAQTAPPVDDNLNLRFANGIVAIAEDKIITIDDVRREVSPLIPQLQREARSEQEFNQKLDALQDNAIQNLIDRVLIIKDFEKDDKRHVPDSFVDDQIAQELTDQFDNDRSKFLAYLRARGSTMRDYRKEVQEDIIYNYMTHQQHKSQSIVSPVRIEQYYKENKDKFYQDDSVHLRLIQLTRAPGDTDGALIGKADSILLRLRSGEKFEDLAKEYSADSRRAKGGDWGWQKRSDLKPEFSEPLFAVKQGECTEPVVTPEGGFLLYADERKYAGIQPLDDVRDQIERILVQQMSRESTDQWLERLRRNGYVKHF